MCLPSEPPSSVSLTPSDQQPTQLSLDQPILDQSFLNQQSLQKEFKKQLDLLKQINAEQLQKQSQPAHNMINQDNPVTQLMKHIAIDERIAKYKPGDTLENYFVELGKPDNSLNEIKEQATHLAELHTKTLRLPDSDFNKIYVDKYEKLYIQYVKNHKKDKLPTFKYTYTGDPSKDKVSLSVLIKKFIDWCKTNEIPQSKHLQIWSSQILEGKAHRLYMNRVDQINDELSVLFYLLQEAFGAAHKVNEYYSKFTYFKRNNGENYRQYIQRFVTLIEDFIFESNMQIHIVMRDPSNYYHENVNYIQYYLTVLITEHYNKKY